MIGLTERPYQPSNTQAQRAPAEDTLAHELQHALAEAQAWHDDALALREDWAQALATLGDIRLPDSTAPPRSAQTLAVLGTLYLVYELEPFIQAAERVVALWASGAIQVHLPQLEPALAKAWHERRMRLTAEERQHLLALAFGAREFAPAMQRVCAGLVALADNAQQHDIREEVGLQQAAVAVMDLATQRLAGAPSIASTDLIAQLREATHWLADKTLQGALGVHDLTALARAALVDQPALADSLRDRMDRARGGSVVLQWLSTHAVHGFAIDPRDAGLQEVIAAAQRWLLAAGAVAPMPLQAALDA